MLDGESDNITLDRFVVFEMEHLMGMGDRFAIPVLLYLFRCVERGLDGSPTLLVLDEAWLMLNHPPFQEKIREWLKVLRKANCVVLFATQSLSDVGKSAIRDVLYESCPTKILLANSEIRGNEESAAQYRAIGLNERQIDIIGRMAKKLDYYYMSPLGRRKYQLGLGPVCLAFVGPRERTMSLLHGTLSRVMASVGPSNGCATATRTRTGERDNSRNGLHITSANSESRNRRHDDILISFYQP